MNTRDRFEERSYRERFRERVVLRGERGCFEKRGRGRFGERGRSRLERWFPGNRFHREKSSCRVREREREVSREKRRNDDHEEERRRGKRGRG